MIYSIIAPIGVVILCIFALVLLLTTEGYLSQTHVPREEHTKPPPTKDRTPSKEEKICALDVVTLVKYPLSEDSEEAVEYLRNNGHASVKVTVRQEKCCSARWQTSLLVFNRVLPGEEIALGFAGHDESDDDIVSAAHTILSAEYLS
ncbi:MAG: hypothetical protein JO154_00855 [Chitinophaga sp.]|uniref:hypothetical protein n=1 Tax=Chitinophaga sp. TaxID=1869181 RepID=UPI0025BCE7F0|nr:hypothetical protein [Chitinophaga sp.]MBV8251124.1 hypothetical protein [Chitinophaga sp.]